MKQQVAPNALTGNVIELIAQDWMLITAGTPGRFNSMTANWGGVGYLWNKPVAYVFIRPERYTFEFVESFDTFSLTFFGKEYKKVLTLFGSQSGREIDKMNHAELTPYFTELGTPAFEEARITFECKKLYSSMLTEGDFIDPSLIEKWYSEKGGLHKMYVAEIINVWINKE